MLIRRKTVAGREWEFHAPLLAGGGTPAAVPLATGSPTANPPPRMNLTDEERGIVREFDALVKAQPVGLGDSVAALAARLGADKAAILFEKLTGISCGCPGRQAWLNKLWPYRGRNTEP